MHIVMMLKQKRIMYLHYIRLSMFAFNISRQVTFLLLFIINFEKPESSRIDFSEHNKIYLHLFKFIYILYKQHQ